MTRRVVLQQVLLEIYGVAGKCFIILCTSVTAALAEMNYCDRRWEEERAEEGEGGRNGRVEQVDSASFTGLLAEFIRFVGDQRFETSILLTIVSICRRLPLALQICPLCSGENSWRRNKHFSSGINFAIFCTVSGVGVPSILSSDLEGIILMIQNKHCEIQSELWLHLCLHLLWRIGLWSYLDVFRVDFLFWDRSGLRQNQYFIEELHVYLSICRKRKLCRVVDLHCPPVLRTASLGGEDPRLGGPARSFQWLDAYWIACPFPQLQQVKWLRSV